jgi:uncharacterized membrane protein
MARLTKSIIIEAPVDKVFEFMRDLRNWPQILPNFQELVPDGKDRYRGVYRMAGVPLTHTSQVSDVVPNEGFKTSSSGALTSSLSYRFEKAGEGTRLTVEGNYEIPIPVLGRVAEAVVVKVNDREIGTALENLRDRLEAGANAKV